MKTTNNKPTKTKKIIKKKKEDFEDVLGDYGYSYDVKKTINITGAGGGSHWWEWELTLNDDGTVDEIAIRNKDGLQYQSESLFCIRTQDDGCSYYKAFYNEEEMEEANTKLKRYYKKELEYDDEDTIDSALWREFEDYY